MFKQQQHSGNTCGQPKYRPPHNLARIVATGMQPRSHDKPCQQNHTEGRVEQGIYMGYLVKRNQYPDQTPDGDAVNTDPEKESGDGGHYNEQVNDDHKLQKIIVQIHPRMNMK